jgi:hypothetical protein
MNSLGKEWISWKRVQPISVNLTHALHMLDRAQCLDFNDQKNERKRRAAVQTRFPCGISPHSDLAFHGSQNDRWYVFVLKPDTQTIEVVVSIDVS